MPRIELRAIRPRKDKILDPQVIRREIEREGLDDAKIQLKMMAERTVRTWKNKPSFKTRYVVTRNELAVDLTPSRDKAGEIWTYIEEGTPPRVIRPKKKGGVLVFRPNYFPKTRPGLLSSVRGRSSGPLVFARASGTQKPHSIKARKWTKAMREQYRKRFLKQMDNAMRRIARSSYA